MPETNWSDLLAKKPQADNDDYMGRLLLRQRRRRALGVLLLAPAVLLGLCAAGLAEPAPAGWEELPFRLHIIANSDSAADQALKLQVRDGVVAYLGPLLAEAETREQAEEIVVANLDQLEALAAGITADFGYGARAEVGQFAFPAKRYGEIYLPAGEYQALRLQLGEAAGHNWWCVLFPPLCFVDECGDFKISGEGSAGYEGSLLAGERQVRLKMRDIFYQDK